MRPTQTLQPSAFAAMGRHLPKFLVLTIITTASMGAGFGLALRLSAAKAPGTSILHPTQTFSEKEWKGTLAPQGDMSDVPVENGANPQSSAAPSPESSIAPKSTNRGFNSIETPFTPVPEISPEPSRSVSPRSLGDNLGGYTPKRPTPKPVEPPAAEDPGYAPPTSDPVPSVEPVAPPNNSAPELPATTPAPVKPNNTRETAPSIVVPTE